MTTQEKNVNPVVKNPGRGEGRHPVDLHVGTRLKTLRISKGVTQGWLAEMVGLTFQQVQKYERGANRVSASKLYQMAQVLGVKVDYFYHGLEGYNDQNQGEDETHPDSIHRRRGLEMMRIMEKMPDTMSLHLVKIGRTMVEDMPNNCDKF